MPLLHWGTLCAHCTSIASPSSHLQFRTNSIPWWDCSSKRNLGATLAIQPSYVRIRPLNWTGQDLVLATPECTHPKTPLSRFLRLSVNNHTALRFSKDPGHSPLDCSPSTARLYILVSADLVATYSSPKYCRDLEACELTLPFLCKVLPFVPAGRFVIGRRPKFCLSGLFSGYVWVDFIPKSCTIFPSSAGIEAESNKG